MTVKEIKEKINSLESELIKIEKKITSENEVIFLKEVMNLLDWVGEGFIEGDYYAPTRYYSQIEGVKNIRLLWDKHIEVKVISPKGELLPSQINVRGVIYNILIEYSSKYGEGVDY